MIHRSMLILLEAEFTGCLQEGTSVRDAGFTVSIKPEQYERICFFRSDSESARVHMQMQEENTKSCDYLVLYTRADEINHKEILCFLELKGKNIIHAVKQICNTHKHVTLLMKQLLERKHHQYVIQSASICMHGTTPRGRAEERVKVQLHQIFGKGNIHIKHVKPGSSYREFGAFLREQYKKQ